MKYGEHLKKVSNEKKKSVRNKNVSQSNIKNHNKSRPKKITKAGIKTINPITWIVRIVTILIILLYMFNINGTISYFTDMATSINEFTIEANYIVTFDSNTGTGTMQPQEISYNVSTNLTANSFKKTGYSFNNWNTKPNGNDRIFTDRQLVNNLNDITLYAQWNMETYNIGYILNNGTVATANPDTYNVETANFTLNNPSKTGYTFKGWSGTGLTGDTNTSVTIAQGSTGDRSYTANYTANTYYIKFNSNGGIGSMSNQTMTYDMPANLTANNFKRTGYIFKEWNTVSDGSGESYDNREEVSNLTTTNGAAIDLYAQWEVQPTKYAVQIYGINQDVAADGTTPLGLTFGPAVGANYQHSYVTHRYEETSEGSGEYYVKIVTHTVETDNSETTSEAYLKDSGSNNVTRTATQVSARENISLHEMSWTEIAAVNDKTVFEDCMLCGDTKSIELTLNSSLASGSIQMARGDGAGMLYNTINEYYIRWNPSKSQNSYVGTGLSLSNDEINYGTIARNTGGYSSSHIRATLVGKENAKAINGVDSLTNEGCAGNVNLTGDTCLYSCIESGLRDVITPKKIKYVTGTSTSSYRLNDNIADPIWLFSEREMYGTGNTSEGIGTSGVGYDKFANTESKYYISLYNISNNTNRVVYYETGSTFVWWLRSLNLSTKTNVRRVGSSDGIDDSFAYGRCGLSFGFCIR